MYNNALSGVSTAGDRFFYVNRLASAGDGRDLRWLRASLECCPPNIVRFLASMPGYIYAQGPAGAIYVNLYVSSEADLRGRMASPSRSRSRATCRGAAARRSRLALTASVARAIKLRIPGLGAETCRCPAGCTPTPTRPRNGPSSR